MNPVVTKFSSHYCVTNLVVATRHGTFSGAALRNGSYGYYEVVISSASTVMDAALEEYAKAAVTEAARYHIAVFAAQEDNEERMKYAEDQLEKARSAPTEEEPSKENPAAEVVL